MREINQIIIHCSDSEWGSSSVIDEWHRERGWDGIGYHYVICNCRSTSDGDFNPEYDGLVQVGRDIAKAGAHAKGYNKHSVGICLIGRHHFTFGQIVALLRLVQELRTQFDVPLSGVVGHYELNPCKTCPNIDMKTLRTMLRLAN